MTQVWSAADDVLETRLRQLRRRLTGGVIVAGVGRVLWWGIGFALVDALLDRLFILDRPQRAVMLLLGLAGAAWLVFRALWRPLQSPPTDEALCWEIERRHPQLQQRMLAAWQLSRLTATTASPTLVQSAIREGRAAAQTADFLSIIDTRRWAQNLALVLAGVVILLSSVAAGFAHEMVGVWFSRNLFLTDREWPQDVHFILQGADQGTLRVPRGEEWPLEVLLTDDSLRTPNDVRLELRDRQSSRPLEQRDRSYRGSLPALIEPTEIRIVAPRAASPWHRVELVDRPAVDSLALHVSPPAYTGLPSGPLPAGGGPYTLLPGTVLLIRGTASKPLSSATLTTGDKQFAFALHDRQQFQRELSAADVRGGEYRIELTDTERMWLPGDSAPKPLTSRTPFTFRLNLAPDREPQVTTRLKGITTLVTPRALIPLEGEVTDDFAVTGMSLQYRHRGVEDAEETAGELALAAAAQLPAGRARFEYGWELEPLGLPLGTSLSFRVEAADNNTVTGPGVGRSSVFLVRVVGDEELRTALLARERTLRAEFENRIRQLDELRTECLALRAAIRPLTEIDAPRRDQLARVARRQKSMGDELSSIARRFEDIALELQLNRLEEPSGPLHTRLTERIIQPLWIAASEQTPPIAETLERARHALDASATRDATLASATDAQQLLLEELRRILAQMESAEGYQEAVNRLVEVQQAQEEVLRRTNAARQDAIRRVLEGGAPKSP